MLTSAYRTVNEALLTLRSSANAPLVWVAYTKAPCRDRESSFPPAIGESWPIVADSHEIEPVNVQLLSPAPFQSFLAMRTYQQVFSPNVCPFLDRIAQCIDARLHAAVFEESTLSASDISFHGHNQWPFAILWARHSSFGVWLGTVCCHCVLYFVFLFSLSLLHWIVLLM